MSMFCGWLRRSTRAGKGGRFVIVIETDSEAACERALESIRHSLPWSVHADVERTVLVGGQDANERFGPLLASGLGTYQRRGKKSEAPCGTR